MSIHQLQTAATALLLEFVFQTGLVPLADGYVEIREFGLHITYEIAAAYSGTEGPGEPPDLMKKLISFVDKHNAMSAIKFVAYNVVAYTGTVYISIAQ